MAWWTCSTNVTSYNSVADYVDAVRVTPPGGPAREVPVQGRRVTVRAEAAGLYTIDTGDGTETFAVNALAKEESDLAGCTTNRSGDWLDASALRLEYRGTAWLWLLLALVLLTVHLAVAARGRAAA